MSGFTGVGASFTALFLSFVGTVLAKSAENDKLLFDFSKPGAAEAWQTVNDGGFAWVRSRSRNPRRRPGDVRVARVGGDVFRPGGSPPQNPVSAVQSSHWPRRSASARCSSIR